MQWLWQTCLLGVGTRACYRNTLIDLFGGDEPPTPVESEVGALSAR